MRDRIVVSEDIETLNDDVLTLKLSSCYNGQLMYYIYLKGGSELIGYCDLRVGHTAYLYYYGNVGYRIHADYRGNGYAYRAVKLLLHTARKLNMEYLIFTVSPENTPSKRTIEKLKAVYQKTVRVPIWHPLYHNERIKMIYRLDLQEENTCDLE